MAARRRQSILIATTGDPVPSVWSSRGSFGQLIEQAIGPVWRGGYQGFDARTEAPPPLDVAAVILTGSASNVPDREAWVVQTEAWLRSVVAEGVPTLGICFGHQLLGQALGGEVQRNPRGREMGTVHIEQVATDPLLVGLPSRFTANATHLDTIVTPPPEATVLAGSELDPHQILRFAPRVYGLQFHPEMDADVMRQYITARRDTLADEGLDVDAMFRAVTDTSEAQAVLWNFVHRIIE
jgi:GMP synthase (glutamine-hydrolysing)